ncbi:zeta-sarcoglycan [Rhopalosiphum maidis]|uniref:zeta-sarcoglycan n=1 Tax=Rhopalosiphum maidis TaxID=43146 RepID=UPI000EFF3EFC|nr:zeta-sarcoglycan [Rhopalosiphum maidis]XP_026820170.1 zeta-sarcoglycan [Rhopalosiphum maidis]
MMHANRQWPFQRSGSNGNGIVYGVDYNHDDGGGADDDDDAAEEFGDFGGDQTASGRRYLTVQPKQWCTSYVAANRQHYIHSTAESAVSHNGGIGLENDVYGGRSTADYFRSKTMPRRTGTATVMDDYVYGNGNDGDGNTTAAVGGGHRQWPASSADIVEYDSSAVADTPTPQQQQQFLLPHNQQQQHHQHLQQTNAFQQKSGAAVSAHDPNVRRAAQVDRHLPVGKRPKSPSKWKTHALYVFLACLLAVVVVNLTLTLWFIRVTQFTSEGIGSMKITHGGLRLSGRTLVTNRLVASAIRSRTGHPLLIESTANVTLTARNSQGRLVNSLKLTKDGLECAQANVFRVTDTRGETLFSADRSKVIVGAQELRVTGSGGAVFQGSVQTPVVRADPRHDLRLESASRRLELSGPQGVTIESRAGDITVSCLMDVKLQSIAGAIQIDAAKVFLKGLKTVKTTSSANMAAAMSADGDGGKSTAQQNSIGSTKKRGAEDKLPSVYQLCVCGNGKVFMSPPDGQCAADNESLVCR